MAPATSNPADRLPSEDGSFDEATPLDYRIARTLAEVEDAWSLVYRSYRRISLIPPNDAELHTTPQAVGPQSAVMLAKYGGDTVATLTTITDQTRGLPLDDVFPDVLAEFRGSGRRMVEMGLFADRRRDLKRSLRTLMELMRYCFFFSYLNDELTDCLAGVHPHHAPFYEKVFGFRRVGNVRQYATVNGHPVVLLDLDRETIDARKRSRGLTYFFEHPLDHDAFTGRYLFDDASLAGSRISAMLKTANRKRPAINGLRGEKVA